MYAATQIGAAQHVLFIKYLNAWWSIACKIVDDWIELNAFMKTINAYEQECSWPNQSLDHLCEFNPFRIKQITKLIFLLRLLMLCLQFTQKGSAHEALCINLELTRWAKSYLSRPNDELALVLVPRLHKAQRASRLRKSPRLSQPHKVSESRFLAINTVRFLQNTIHQSYAKNLANLWCDVNAYILYMCICIKRTPLLTRRWALAAVLHRLCRD